MPRIELNGMKPSLILILFLVVCSVPAGWGVTLTPLDLEGKDGKPEELEVVSRDYRIRFELIKGGEVSSLIYTPLNHEFRAENYYKQRFFLFSERIQGVKDEGAAPFDYKVVSDKPGELILEFARPRETLAFDVRKRLTIRDDTPAIRVEVIIENPSAEAGEVAVKVSNGLSLGRVRSVYFLPGADGIITGVDKAEESASVFIYAPELAGAWQGGVNDKGLGGVFAFDWADVDAMQVSMYKTLGSVLETFLRKQEIPAGGTFQFSYTFLPIQNFRVLDGATGDLVGGIVFGEAPGGGWKAGATVPVTIQMAAGAARTAQVAWQWIRRDDATVVTQDKKEIRIEAGKTVNIAAECPAPKDGLYVFHVRVTSPDRPTLEMERALEVGGTKLSFQPTPPAGPQRGTHDADLRVGPAPMDPQFRTIDPAFHTQAIPFLKNAAVGSVKVLFATPADSTLGHVREIAQRGDVDYEYFAIGKIQTPRDALNPIDVRQMLNKVRASAPDVFFSLALNWPLGLGAEASRTLIERVRGGMGLVVTLSDLEQPEWKRLLADAVPVETPSVPPVGVETPALKRFQLGGGRVAVLVCHTSNYRDGGEAALGEWTKISTPPTTVKVSEPDWRGFEYSYARLVQAIQWAGKHDAGPVIASAKIQSQSVRVAVDNPGPPVDGTLSALVRGRNWNEGARAEAKVAIPSGHSEQTLTLDGAASGGAHVVELRLRDAKDKMLAFASVGWDEPARVTMSVLNSPNYRRVGNPGELTIEVAGEPVSGTLQIRIRDRFDRLVLSEDRALDVTKNPQKVSVSLAPIRPLGAYHEITAEFFAKDGGNPVAELSEPVYLLPDHPDDRDRFQLGVADSPERKALHLQALIPTMRDLGFTMHTHSHYDPLLFGTGAGKSTTVGLSPMHAGRYNATGKEASSMDGNVMLPSLLPAADVVPLTKERWQKAARESYEAGAWMLLLDDERRMSGDFDLSETTLAGFRQWLRGRYPGIAALNKTWGADFKDFDSVMPRVRAEVEGKPNQAPWLEFRMFIGDVLGEYFMKKPSEWAAEISPDLSVGEFGIFEPSWTWPIDWSRYAKFYQTTQRYGDTQGVLEDLFRSFAPGTRHSRWMGYSMLAISNGDRLAPWRSLLNGGSAAWYWAMVDNGYWNYGVATSDQRPTAGYAALAKDEFPDLTGGIDRVMLASTFTEDAIVMAYSYPSWVIDTSALGAAAKRTIEEMGLQHHYVNLEGLNAAALREAGTRLLVLQDVSCLSKEQAAALQEFVASGGVVLGVGCLGWRDLHGAPWADGPVSDAVFGLKTGTIEPIKEPVSAILNGKKILVGGAVRGITAADATVLAQAGKVPILTVKRQGKGVAFWLNSDMAERKAIKAGDDNEAAGELDAKVPGARFQLFDEVLKTAGITPRSRIVADGQPVYKNESWYYESPSGRSLFVARHLNEDKPMALTFDRKAFVYDMRTGKFFGETQQIEDILPPGRMKIYALLDDRIASVTLTPQRKQYKRGETAVVQVALQGDKRPVDLNAVRVAVTAADGNEIPAYSSTHLVRDGKLELQIPLALDEPLGAHTVKATDAISHTEGTAVFDVIE